MKRATVLWSDSLLHDKGQVNWGLWRTPVFCVVTLLQSCLACRCYSISLFGVFCQQWDLSDGHGEFTFRFAALERGIEFKASTTVMMTAMHVHCKYLSLWKKEGKIGEDHDEGKMIDEDKRCNLKIKWLTVLFVIMLCQVFGPCTQCLILISGLEAGDAGRQMEDYSGPNCLPCSHTSICWRRDPWGFLLLSSSLSCRHCVQVTDAPSLTFTSNTPACMSSFDTADSLHTTQRYHVIS